jgi:8-oxo-dGTP diphosphatase
MIRAAGGIIVRDDNVLIVHRPKYGDWSLPKGKCKAGESDEACALREIEEETGLNCELERVLGETRYQAFGGPKVVKWFLMRPLDGEFSPSDEIDEIAWVPIAEVHDRVTFDVGVEQLERL